MEKSGYQRWYKNIDVYQIPYRLIQFLILMVGKENTRYYREVPMLQITRSEILQLGLSGEKRGQIKRILKDLDCVFLPDVIIDIIISYIRES